MFILIKETDSRFENEIGSLFVNVEHIVSLKQQIDDDQTFTVVCTENQEFHTLETMASLLNKIEKARAN